VVRVRPLSRQQASAHVESGSPQADPQFRAGDLQRPGCHTDDLGDLVSALSPLHEVADLLHPFWSKLRWPSMIEGLQFELNGLDHCSISYLHLRTRSD
jgi:hypothetical protein